MKAKLSGGQSKTKPGSSGENKQGGANPGKQNATTTPSQSNNATNTNVKAENIIAGACGNQGYEPICSREEMVEAYKGEYCLFKDYQQTMLLISLLISHTMLNFVLFLYLFHGVMLKKTFRPKSFLLCRTPPFV